MSLPTVDQLPTLQLPEGMAMPMHVQVPTRLFRISEVTGAHIVVGILLPPDVFTGLNAQKAFAARKKFNRDETEEAIDAIPANGVAEIQHGNKRVYLTRLTTYAKVRSYAERKRP